MAMAPLIINKVLPLFLILLTSSLISAYQFPLNTRGLLELQDDGDDDNDEQHPVIKKSTSSSISKNQSKLTKPTTTIASSSPKNHSKLTKPTTIITSSFPKNQTKIIKSPPFASSKNKTKLTKPKPSNSTASSTPKSQLKKLNSTTNASKKSTDLTISASPKQNKTSTVNKGSKAQPKKQPGWIIDDNDDLVSNFRDLPSKFQESFIPDLERITKSSKTYLTRYNKEFASGFKPYVGNRYAATVASLASIAFITIPLILVLLIFNRIKAYFSLQKLLIFIQVYLSIYFTILCLSSLLTGLEPLEFFYATSKSTYVGLQVLQTLAYVLYLLLLLMYLILVFSTETAPATKLLGLGQTLLGLAVGLHYYTTVFHRAVLRQPPKTSWKAHGLYATCFLVICLMGRVDRRKKAYLVDGDEEGKQS